MSIAIIITISELILIMIIIIIIKIIISLYKFQSIIEFSRTLGKSYAW